MDLSEYEDTDTPAIHTYDVRQFLSIVVIPKEYNFLAYLGVNVIELGAIVTSLRSEL
ncbi:hypothetical protein [Phocicoccus pinnipedialis]|uniref:hypothetical protein n=1 Tax=Phocicoccus pinnipedialis TaxID=110845 RepID=UPI0016404CEC|nr:hypothetical protein [Jeotgalicoccus pinnipedialis]MBP1940165.1 hypothetical protein [Jeotgalicoccus pinnipedialis]